MVQYTVSAKSPSDGFELVVISFLWSNACPIGRRPLGGAGQGGISLSRTPAVNWEEGRGKFQSDSRDGR